VNAVANWKFRGSLQ